jgi:hypothetical protein
MLPIWLRLQFGVSAVAAAGLLFANAADQLRPELKLPRRRARLPTFILIIALTLAEGYSDVEVIRACASSSRPCGVAPMARAASRMSRLDVHVTLTFSVFAHASGASALGTWLRGGAGPRDSGVGPYWCG